MRHLHFDDILSSLNRGSCVEQFLGGALSNGQQTIRWIEIRPNEKMFEVWQFAAPDLGNLDYHDFYDWAGEEGEAMIAILPTADEALKVAETDLKARRNAWTNPGVSQEDYRDYVTGQRSPTWTPAQP